MKKLIFAFAIMLVTVSCASFESRFTSHTGCDESEIKVLKKSNNLFGNQNYAIQCRGRTYYCTESFIEKQYSNLKCTEQARKAK